MFAKPKSWISGGLWKPKNPHSLEHLKYLHNVLSKHQVVTEQNKGLLVETLRSISEILIWGDQNDSTVFDFFLEKNMLAFFLRFMRQKSGRYICVQLLQTLNILFENISNETSVYYLLSNNHINSIIVHKFDFSDEEVMAYYISFLKTLSLKLNKHTIHFFYNEHTNDFALYTEAIKFFNHSESMVRIAVRTITLNVYKVDDKSMLRYIRDRTAAPYFSNLVWFIGSHIIDVDSCVRNDADHNSRDRLATLVAEHLDHLHYLNDILCLNIDALNEVLTDHLLNRLLIPLYVYSLTKRRRSSTRTTKPKPRYAGRRKDERPHVSSVVSLFLLSQVFLIISHSPLVRQLADIIFNGDMDVCMDMPQSSSPQIGRNNCKRAFVKPSESLAQTLEMNRGRRSKRSRRSQEREREKEREKEAEEAASSSSGAAAAAGGESARSSPQPESTEAENTAETGNDAELEAVAEVSEPAAETSVPTEERPATSDGAEAGSEGTATPPSEATSESLSVEPQPPNQNSTDEEKLLINGSLQQTPEFTLTNRPYLEAVFNALECSENDYEALFALCLLYALGHNPGINQELLDTVLMPSDKSISKEHYNVALVERLIKIISLSCQTGSRVRLATLEMSSLLLNHLVFSKATTCYLQDRHLAAIEGAREESTLLLRNFYKSEEIFLDMFEDEYREMKSRPLNVEYLMMDESILLPPTGTPLTGIDFNKRLPCGEVERARRAIRVFFLLRDLSLTLRSEPEAQLPLTKQEECVKVNDVLDLNNSDLIACTVIARDKKSRDNHLSISVQKLIQPSKKERRFLVIDVLQLILVEPDTRRLGWGVVKFVGFLQDVEVSGDKDDSRSLHITIHKPSMNVHARPLPLLSARFTFDDHIRCMAAKQRLTKGRLRARQRKMQMIARLVELPTHVVESMYHPPPYAQPATALRTSTPTSAIPGRGHAVRSGKRDPQSAVASGSAASSFVAGRERGQRSRTGGSSQPIAIRAGGARRQLVQAQESTEVEEAEEALAPEVNALQSLNDKKGKENQKAGADVPLEDLSSKKSSSPLARRSSAGRIPRSTSYSPQRVRGSPSGSPCSSPKRQSSPLAVRVTSADRTRSESRSPARIRRTGSFPSPHSTHSSSDNVSTDSKTSKSNVGSTSFTVEPKQRSKSLSQVPKDTQDGKPRSGSDPLQSSEKTHEPVQQPKERKKSGSSSTGVKTLTPAQAPSVSLICASVDVQSVDSPKLVTPVAAAKIHNFSDVSSTTSFDSEGFSSGFGSPRLFRVSDLYPETRPDFPTPKIAESTSETEGSATDARDKSGAVATDLNDEVKKNSESRVEDSTSAVDGDVSATEISKCDCLDDNAEKVGECSEQEVDVSEDKSEAAAPTTKHLEPKDLNLDIPFIDASFHESMIKSKTEVCEQAGDASVVEETSAEQPGPSTSTSPPAEKPATPLKESESEISKKPPLQIRTSSVNADVSNTCAEPEHVERCVDPPATASEQLSRLVQSETEPYSICDDPNSLELTKPLNNATDDAKEEESNSPTSEL